MAWSRHHYWFGAGMWSEWPQYTKEELQDTFRRLRDPLYNAGTGLCYEIRSDEEMKEKQ